MAIRFVIKKYFFNKEDGSISIEFLKDTDKLIDFELPTMLNKNIFTEDSLPNYNLPAV